jgi:hypothetical protein
MDTSLKVFLNNYTEMNFSTVIEEKSRDLSAGKKFLFTLRTGKSELTPLISAGMKCVVAVPGNRSLKGIIKEKSTSNGQIRITCQTGRAAHNLFQENLL